MTAALLSQIALMVGAPVVLLAALGRGFGIPMRIFLWGAAAFILSQAVRLPLLQGWTHLVLSGVLPVPPAAWAPASNIAILSLTAGLFEEGARYLVLRWGLPDRRSWSDAIGLGAGHGGCEAIILGVVVAIGAIQLWALRDLGVEAMPGSDLGARTAVAQHVAYFWSRPWYEPVLGGVERISAIGLHIALAVLVMEAVRCRRWRWLVGAIVLHAAANAMATVLAQRAGLVVTEAALLVVAVGALWLVVRPRLLQAQPEPRE